MNEGRYQINNHVIEDLYNLWLKLKMDKNPAQVVIKLRINSMYEEKTKPIETYTIIKYSQHDSENMFH